MLDCPIQEVRSHVDKWHSLPGIFQGGRNVEGSTGVGCGGNNMLFIAKGDITGHKHSNPVVPDWLAHSIVLGHRLIRARVPK